MRLYFNRLEVNTFSKGLCFIYCLCRRCGDFDALTEPTSFAKQAKLPVHNALNGTSLTPALRSANVLSPCHHFALWQAARLISYRIAL